MSLNVAIDITPILGRRTGIGNVVSHLYDELKLQSEIELIPFTLSYKAKNFTQQLPNNNLFFQYPASILVEIWKKSNYFSIDPKLGKVNIIHSTNYVSPPTKFPSLITIHDLTYIKYPDLVSNSTKRLSPLILKRIKNGSFIHVPTKAILDDVLSYYGESLISKDRIFQVPFALPNLVHGDPSERIKNICDSSPFILNIGMLEPRKNQARLVSAFESVHEQFPFLKLLIVGPEGPSHTEINLALSKINPKARKNVLIMGPVSESDKTYLLTKSEMIVYPSLYEGFGLPLLEAMSVNTPIVTTKEGSLEEIAKDSALYVEAKNIDSISNGIINVLASSELKDRLIRSGELRLKDFSWEATTQQMLDVYKMITNNKVQK